MVEYDEAGRLIPGDSQKGMEEEEVRLIGLPGNRLEVAAGVLARCFHANHEQLSLAGAPPLL